MNIAVLYICTGKYSVFWNEFYASCEQYFCPDVKKHYFVFSDTLNNLNQNNVTTFYQDNLGWPFNTMYRYQVFLRATNELYQFDYVVFFNANTMFIQDISVNEFFGTEDKSDLVAAIHPGYFNKSKDKWPVETRKSSIANTINLVHYYQGAINGGKSSVFIPLIKQLAQNIDVDLHNGIVAKWHDESHWNAYLNNNFEQIKDKLNILTPDYLYPDGWNLPFAPKILLRDKNKYGGHNLLRGMKAAHSGLIKRIIKKLVK